MIDINILTTKLDNKYCGANVNTATQLRGIFNVTIGSSNKEKKVW